MSFQNKHRRLSVEEARQLSIIAINNNPGDETADSDFAPDESPCQFSTYPVCTVMKGRMGITAHATDNLDLIIASILDAIQEAMTLDLLIEPLCTETPCIVEKVVYWGDILEQVQSNVATVLVGGSPPGDNGNGSGGTGGTDGTDGNTLPGDGNGGDGNNAVTTPPNGGDDDDDSNGSGGVDGTGTGSGGDDSTGSGAANGTSTLAPNQGNETQGNGTIPVTPNKPSVSEANEARASNDDGNSQLFLIAAVPLAVLVAFLLLVAKDRKRRQQQILLIWRITF
jgi:hypothetical protein